MNYEMKWSLAAAVGSVLIVSQLVSTASAADADAPSTQPTTQPDRKSDRGNRADRPAGERGRDIRDIRDRNGGFMQGRAPGESYRNEELPGEDEWAEIIEFMKVNSPVRLEMYEKLEATKIDRPIQSARRRIAGRYRDLSSMKDRHPDMYEFALKQAVLEDRILGQMRDQRDAKEDEALHAKLRETVKAYVDNFLDEREARLKKLREMVEKETQTIEHDRASMDELIDKQAERFEKEMSRMIDFWENPEKFMPQNPGSP